MESKEKILKWMKTLKVIAYILLGLSMAFAILSLVLAFVMVEQQHTLLKTFVSSVFTVIICLVMLKALLSIQSEQTPFNRSIIKKIELIALLVLLNSCTSSTIASVLDCIVSIFEPNYAVSVLFSIEITGICTSIFIFFLALIFEYGRILQQKDDETL